jgi:hypothetical protein
MVTPCGHSFSTTSITSWLRQCGGGAKTCPVCKSVISESVVPNWALRNAVDRYPHLSCSCWRHSSKLTLRARVCACGRWCRYHQKYGKKRASSSFEEPLPFQGQVHIDLDDYPVKPSGTPLPSQENDVCLCLPYVCRV